MQNGLTINSCRLTSTGLCELHCHPSIFISLVVLWPPHSDTPPHVSLTPSTLLMQISSSSLWVSQGHSQAPVSYLSAPENSMYLSAPENFIHCKGSDAILPFSKLLIRLDSSSHSPGFFISFPQGHLFLKFTLSCLYLFSTPPSTINTLVLLS